MHLRKSDVSFIIGLWMRIFTVRLEFVWKRQRVWQMKHKAGKVNREEFLRAVARESGVSLEDVITVANAMESQALVIAEAGKELSVTGFGQFYAQRHKGHPVQFGEPKNIVSDYVVYKFSASHVINDKLRKFDDDHGIPLK